MGKGAAVAIVLIIVVVAAAYMFYPPFRELIPLSHTSSTTATTTSTQAPATTTTTSAQTTGTTSSSTTTTTTATTTTTKTTTTSKPGNRTVTMPKVAVNETLENLNKTVQEIVAIEENATQTTESGLYPYAQKIIEEYYNRIMKEDLNITSLFDTDIVDEASLIEMHKQLYSSFDMLNYTIEWLGYNEFTENIPQGYSMVDAVTYLLNTTFKDREGNILENSVKLITYVGLMNNGTVKILQTVPA